MTIRCFATGVDGTRDGVEVCLGDLPTEQAEFEGLLTKLRNTRVELGVFVRVAMEYHRSCDDDKFRSTLEFARDNMQLEGEAAAEIFTNLAADCLYRSSLPGVNKVEVLEQFVANYVEAGKYNPNDPYMAALGAFYEIQQGKLKEAENKLGMMGTLIMRDNLTTYGYIQNVAWGSFYYQRGNYSAAYDSLNKAVLAKPNSGAGIRVAIGICLFKMEQFSRAGAALESALESAPNDLNGLLTMGLFKRMEASRDRDHHKRRKHRMDAFDFFSVAHDRVASENLDTECYIALTQIANHEFFAWKIVDESAEVTNDFKTVVVDGVGHEFDAEPIPPLKVDGRNNVKAISVREEGDKTFIHVSEDDREYFRGRKSKVVEVDKKSYKEVKEACTIAAKKGSEQVKAESFYVLGRLFHATNQLTMAEKCYKKVIKNPSIKMSLASFGLGQLYLGQEKHEEALKKFEDVAKVAPEDKDTMAYIILVKSLLHQTVVNYDKVRDAAVGFPYELDLWLLQAQNRFQSGAEFQNALRCYENALKCGVDGGITDELKYSVFANMAILYHNVGNIKKATTFARQALDREYIDEDANPVFTHGENNIFFTYSDTAGSVKATDTEGMFDFGSNVGDLKAGDDLLLDDVLHKVESISGKTVTTKCPLSFPVGKSMALRIKIPRRNFNDKTLMRCYNYARILEDQGCSMAAREIYNEILSSHPQFTECYLRLSWMEREIGNFTEAESWLQKALKVNPNEPDANVSLGDLYARRDDWDKAKKMYEKVNSKFVAESEQDARTMISQGNLYYRSLADNSNYEKNLKHSYKFYHTVLAKSKRNAYAANGLGMICAEMKRFDAAREMFSRVRESNIAASDDIASNLAHVHLFQNKNMEAIQLYQSTMKAALSSGNAPMSYASLIECLGLANLRNGQHKEALRTLLRSLHYDPTTPHFWFNYAYIGEELASLALKSTKQKSADEINGIINTLRIAEDMFDFTASDIVATGRLKYDKKKSLSHKDNCQRLKMKAAASLATAQKQTAAHMEQKQAREGARKQAAQEKARMEATRLEEVAEVKRVERARVIEATERLNSLKKTWATVPPKPVPGEKKPRKKKDGTGAFVDDYQDGLPDDIFDSDGEDELGGAPALKPVVNDSLMDSDDDVPPPPRPSSPTAGVKRDAESESLFGDSDDEPATKTRRIVAVDGA